METKEKQRINAESYAIAQYAANKIRDKNGKPVYDGDDFLPYKLDNQTNGKDIKECVSPRTAKIMGRLIEAGKLPTRVEAAAKARING